MPRACGIRIGPRRFELFVLDGSPKKPKVITSVAGDYDADAEDSFAAAAATLKRALREHSVPRENVGVAIEGRSAAFRRLQLPVSEAAKIEQVIKYEVEGELPQFNIDDVVVDFHILDASPTESNLLVTAVPKEEVRRAIDQCTAAGFEPLEVELDATALVNAAVGTGLCTVETAQVLVHVGEESTAVAIVDGTQVRELRAIQIGALTGRRVHKPEPELALEPDAEAPPAPAPASAEDEAQRRMEIVGRIRRELARSVSGARTVNELAGIYVCGYELPELEGADVLGLPVRHIEELRVESEESPESGYGSAAVAYGVALRQLGGGVLKSRLRREELRFSGALERLELPLAVVALLLVTMLGVWNIFIQKEREFVDVALASWRDSSNNFMYPDPRQGKTAKLRYPSDKIKGYVEMLRPIPGEGGVELTQDDPDRNRLEQLTWIRQMLRNEVSQLEKELGRDGEIQQPQSALKAMTVVLDVLERNKDVIRRPSIRKINATYQTASRDKPDRVIVSMDIVFFGDTSTQATADFERFKELLASQPWYLDFADTRSEPLQPPDGEGGRQGILKNGIKIEVDVSKAPSELRS